MSGMAVKWAMRQRGLKPATKIVLWCLADHHNSKAGDCFPMQETIAAECEMSRSTVNLHLDVLEKRGLIRRVASLNDQTKRQRPTRYILFLDAAPVSENRTEAVSENQTQDGKAVSELVSDFSHPAGKPCPKNGESRVRNSDSNLGREPTEEVAAGREREPAIATEALGALLSRVMVAIGLNPNDILSAHWMPNVAEQHILGWIKAGIPPDAIERVAGESRKRHRDPPNGPKALDGAMRAWLTARNAPAFSAPSTPSDTGPTDARRPSGPSRLNRVLNGAVARAEARAAALDRGPSEDPAVQLLRPSRG